MKFQTATRVLCVLVLLAIVSACGGKAIDRDAPDFDKRIRSGEIFVWTEDIEGTELKIVRALGWSDVPPNVGWEVFQDLENLDQFLTRVEESKLLPNNGDKKVLRIVVNAPAIALAGGYDRMVMVMEIEESISDDGVRRGEFTSIQGNIKRAYGSWTVEPYGPKRDTSLVTFSMFIQFEEFYIPDAVANDQVSTFLEQWASDLRGYVEDPNNRIKLEKAAAERAGKDASEIGPKLDNLGDFLQ